MDGDELPRAIASDPADEAEMDDEPEQTEALQLKVVMKKGETVDQINARAALTSEYNASHSIWMLNQITAFKDADITELADRLEYQTQLLKTGDLGRAESILASQAHTLDSLFHHLLTRSCWNMGEYLDVAEKYMKLALKAQSQCRATLDSLAAMKKPPPDLIRQTNIAHGHQQVNNFTKNEKTQSKLLEEIDGERMGPGTQERPIRCDQDMETVGEKHRSKDT